MQIVAKGMSHLPIILYWKTKFCLPLSISLKYTKISKLFLLPLFYYKRTQNISPYEGPQNKIQWNLLFTLFWGLIKDGVHSRKCKYHNLRPYLHLNPLLECSTNDVSKLLCNVWTFLWHIIPRNIPYHHAS
jgi:hypothetical protein